MNSFKNILTFILKIYFRLYFFIFGNLKLNETSKKVIELYKSKDFSSLFSEIRIWDAPFEKVEKVTPDRGLIVDLGSGDGILSNYLAVANTKRKLLGIEVNKKRLKEANRGLKNTSFKYGSILNFKYPKADVFILSHVLHHLPSFKDQEKVIGKAYSSLTKGGKLIIVEIAEKPFLKYIFTWLTDAIIVPILFEGKLFSTDFYYRKTSEWLQILKKQGFSTKHFLINKNKPFSHVIIVASKFKN